MKLYTLMSGDKFVDPSLVKVVAKPAKNCLFDDLKEAEEEVEKLHQEAQSSITFIETEGPKMKRKYENAKRRLKTYEEKLKNKKKLSYAEVINLEKYIATAEYDIKFNDVTVTYPRRLKLWKKVLNTRVVEIKFKDI